MSRSWRAPGQSHSTNCARRRNNGGRRRGRVSTLTHEVLGANNGVLGECRRDGGQARMIRSVPRQRPGVNDSAARCRQSQAVYVNAFAFELRVVGDGRIIVDPNIFVRVTNDVHYDAVDAAAVSIRFDDRRLVGFKTTPSRYHDSGIFCQVDGNRRYHPKIGSRAVRQVAAGVRHVRWAVVRC